MNKPDIIKLFNGFGCAITQDDIWQVQSATVIKHKALERLAASARIAFDAPTIIRANADEAVILATGRLNDRVEWSIGEALVNVNYRVTGKQAAYVYAMAEKRAKDRVILKLAGLHGLYSEDEADEFDQRNANASVERGAPAGPSDEYSMAIEAMRKNADRPSLRAWMAAQKDVLREILGPGERAKLMEEYAAYGRSLPEDQKEAA
jgi:hypothetical protein